LFEGSAGWRGQLSILGWGILMSLRRRILLAKLVEAAGRGANHRYSVSRGFLNCGWRFVIGIGAVLGSSLILILRALFTIGSKEGIAHMAAGDFSIRATWFWRRRRLIRFINMDALLRGAQAAGRSASPRRGIFSTS